MNTKQLLTANILIAKKVQISILIFLESIKKTICLDRAQSLMIKVRFKGLALALTAIITPVIFSENPLAPYLAKTIYTPQNSIISSECAYIDSNVPGVAEALAIDFKLDRGALAISDFEIMNYRPLIGCEDLLEISLDSKGELTSALFSTSSLVIKGSDSTIYNLTTGFNEERNSVEETGKYLFDSINYSIASTKACSDIIESASSVSPQIYFQKIRSLVGTVRERNHTQYIDDVSSDSKAKTKSGPVAHWFSVAAIEYARSAYPEPFDNFLFGDRTITWDAYQKYLGALCDVYLKNDTKGALYIEATTLSGILWDQIERGEHASSWAQFPYVETGRNVIAAPVLAGLSYYTKYIAGGGVIIVAGDNVDDSALLAARDSVIYMTSARLEMRGILQANHARISLFMETASELPEFGACVRQNYVPRFCVDSDLGEKTEGFAQGMTDATMTAKANQICRPSNFNIGGNQVIHELAHGINHMIFEETNEAYWYDRIIPLASAARDNGTFLGRPLGEYWAMAVEGYIMDKGERFKTEFPTRKYIAENHPGLYELLTRYLPTEPWDYCPGVTEYMRTQ